MQRDSSRAVIKKGVVELFSDMMLMKFKPKNTEGMRLAKDMHPVRRRLLSEDKIGLSETQQTTQVGEKLSHIQFLEVASKQAVILGNVNQLDMIGLDGLTHNFVDTYHYWSLNISRPILDLKVNPKKQLFLLLCPKALLLFSYNSLRRDRIEPEQLVSIEIKGQVRFMQFPTSDIIALFYENHFQLYSLNDANQVSKKAQKKYGVGQGFKLLAVPLAIDQSVNLFFEQKQTGRKTFGLWCLEVQLGGEHARLQTIYKIYDIMIGLKKQLILENYSKDIVFLNLGQQILVAKKGYILDSVNINLQIQHSYLKYLPAKQILVHIERSGMQIYSFQIDVSSLPHRIHLKCLDSIEIPSCRNRGKLMSLLPMFDSNYALFYEDEMTKYTTKGEIFYSFALSFSVGVSEKVNKVLDIGIDMGKLSEDQLEQKCDILRKMGLADRQIYLEIWKKSGRSSLRDYQFILSTQDYKTIKTEIENKLKKQSMSFKEVYKIEESCLLMLRSQLMGERCNENIIKDFLTCSLLLRRLSLYRELHQIEPRNTQDHHFFINIQDYYTFKNTQLKQFLMEKLALLELGKPNALNQVRLVLSHFRFVYRYIYHDLLQQIIKSIKNNLKTILIALPELLPMEEGGFWSSISESEWQEGLYLSKITNVSNKEIIEQFVHGLWFKRHWLTDHDLIARSAKEIQARSLRNNSVQTFFFFLQKAFENLKDEQKIKELLAHLEEVYPRFPNHLRKREILYWKLWKYYCQNYEAAKCPKLSLRQFFRLQDHELFIYFFIFEKGRKNSLLRQVKPIYEAELDGGNIFNQSLLNYFSNQSSEVSHLKYLLNRINNEKKEFHALHEGMYEVLVKAMQNKLRIGGQNDVPVDEVLIYVENIPMAPDNKTMIAELETIQKISDESQTFRKIKINMNLREIIQNYEIVIERLVDYHFKKNNIVAIDSKSTLLTKTYRILAQIQSLKDKIYGSDYNELALFIYLTRLLEHEEKIHFAQAIVSDEYLNNFYFIDLKVIESLVQYMYHWKFSQNTSFPANSSYINALVELLPHDNYIRVYIESELEFAVLLSTNREPIRYPLCPKGQYPHVNDVEELIKDIDSQNILKISISAVTNCMLKLREACIKKAQQESQIIPRDEIEPHSIYQVFIGAYLTRNLIIQVIPLIRECLGLIQEPNPILPLVMIYRLLPELNEESRNSLTRISSYLFKNSLQLLSIVEQLLHSKFTGLEASEFLKNKLILVKANYSNFEENNEVFTVYFRHLGEQIKGQSRKALVERCLLRLKKVKIQFSYEYLLDFIFLILCQSPLSLAIFLKSIENTKWKIIRHFLSYLIQQDIFDELQVLQLVRRAFILLMRSHHDGQPIRQLVKQFGSVTLCEQFNAPVYQEPSELQRKMLKNITIFQRKKAKICALERSFKHNHRKHVFSNKEASLKQHILHPQKNKDKNADYVFSDSDDDYRPDEPESPLITAAKKKRKLSKIKFDPTQERKNFIKRDNIRNVANRRKSPIKAYQQGENRHSSQQDEFSQEIKKNNSKIKKYFSMDVRSGYDQQEGPPVFQESRANTPRLSFHKQSADQSPPLNIQQPERKTSPPPRVTSPLKRQASNKLNIIQRRSFESPKSPSHVKAMRSLDQLADRLLQEEIDQPDLRILKIQTKESEEASEKAVEQVDLQPEIAVLVKKIYKTYSEKLQSQPFNLKVLNEQKSKNDNFASLLKKVISQIWQKPQKSADISIKLIIQIATKYRQLVPINIPYAQIYEKIAKCEAMYGLYLPMNKMLPLLALYMKPGPPQDLFNIIKPNIISVCDQQNLLKISKVISIGFKKNTLEQDIILLYLQTRVEKIPQNISEQQLSIIFEKFKGLLSKIQVKLLVDKAESIVSHCYHFDARRKLVQLLIDTIRMKGNGKDAKELAIKLK